MAKKTRSWKELTKLKKSIDIIYNSETIFVMEELGDIEFNSAYNIIINSLSNKSESSFLLSLSENKEVFAFLFKNMIKGFTFDNLTDEEIMETADNMPGEVKEQINTAVEVLVMRRFYKRTNYIKEVNDSFKELGLSEEATTTEKTATTT